MIVLDEQAPPDMRLMKAKTSPVNQGLSGEKKRGFRKFAYTVFWVFAPVHFYLGWSLLGDLHVDPAFQFLGGAMLVLSALLIPFGTLASIFVERQVVADRLVWAGSLALGWFSSLLIFTLIRDLALLFPAGRDWTGASAIAVVGLSVGVTLIGFLNARRVARVVRVDIPLATLPSALEGFSIAQISDVHVGSTIKAGYVRNIVERVNDLNPDMVAVTGDVVDGKVHQLADDVAPLGQLKARYGSYVVTGNHEYYSGADDWMDAFSGLGLQPLRNEHRVIEHHGTSIVIAGVNDYSAASLDPANGSDPRAALAGSPADAPKILLAHQPRSAKAALKAGFDLQLSGHTHGGQFWPWNHFVRMQQPFVAGLRRMGKLSIYTSRGTGYWGPPKRFGAPSEITLITLRKANRVNSSSCVPPSGHDGCEFLSANGS